ncbi:MAG: S-methyl-5'-thioadenosine phosphorylase [Candidatus Diapherotrites archaeon]|nr:S-methyl-5'-thioadenosine phosphorylase [Candidatus Diapherotrites archaeon]
MIGIIGGSGLEDPKLLHNVRGVKIKTPFGKHTPIKKGKINGIEVAVLSRHGYKHEHSPTAVPYKANMWALKKLGCKAIIATSACGSLKEEIKPNTFSLPSQFLDRTHHRDQSYTEHGKVLHISMAEPFSAELRKILLKKCKELGYACTAETTVVTIEGPRFSTKAESKFYRLLECDLINMTTVPEVCLAKEIEIPYQVINLVTDYDCWREGTAPVSFEKVMKVMRENAEKVKKLIVETLPEIDEEFR